MPTRELTVRLRLTCEEPPPTVRAGAEVEFGLQDKAGDLQPGLTLPDGSLRFEGQVRATPGPDGMLRLRGPIVHGTAIAPFLYLSCRSASPPGQPWIFRLKVPLARIDARALGRDRDAGAVTLEARIRATSGGSVPLLGSGWTRGGEPAAAQR
ncbi:MAG: hypothetical protein H0U52_07425 [Chloroflexi bacterium]|nr:hypothetical protein [Chloroflexota bacterium]